MTSGDVIKSAFARKFTPASSSGGSPFKRHLRLMACAVLKDGLGEDEATRLQNDSIDWLGVLVDGTRALLNSISGRDRG